MDNPVGKTEANTRKRQLLVDRCWPLNPAKAEIIIYTRARLIPRSPYMITDNTRCGASSIIDARARAVISKDRKQRVAI